MPKKIVRKYVYSITFKTAYFEKLVDIDLIALSDNDLIKVFKKVYGLRAKLISTNNKRIKLQN